MTEKRAGRELAKWVAVTLAVLLGLYVGAYYAMVRPIQRYPYILPKYIDARFSDPLTREELRSYLLWGDRYERFFYPIHWMDRHIRPHVWEL